METVLAIAAGVLVVVFVSSFVAGWVGVSLIQNWWAKDKDKY
jgi:hypothetical protein